MDKALLDVLVDLGSLGLASGAIFWLYLRANTRLDNLTVSFQEQIREMQDRFDKKESDLRAACDDRISRFDSVVERYNTERDVLLQQLVTGQQKAVTACDELEERVEKMHDNVIVGLGEMREHYARQEGTSASTRKKR